MRFSRGPTNRKKRKSPIPDLRCEQNLTKHFTERYYRDKAGWLKASARGLTFRMTAEQVLNHVLPALAGVKPNLTI
jgi:hypothetical protein